MKKKKLTKRLNEAINYAKQLEVKTKELMDECILHKAEIEAEKKIAEDTERHLQIAEKEIKRLNMIINYLEARNLENLEK